MELLKLFKQKWFLFNFFGAIILVWAVANFSMSRVAKYTKHGFSIDVPDLTGYPIEEIPSILDSLNLRYIVDDSVFSPIQDYGVVLEQNPIAHSKVKENRTIYLTINSQSPPMLKMPNLINLSRRQALNTLNVLGLESDKLEYRPDICMDCVLDQKMGDKVIRPGTPIERGAKITLVLGKGRTNEQIDIPNLMGKPLDLAVMSLFEKSLNVGAVVQYDFCKTQQDSANAVVFKQKPMGKAYMGSQVDLWFTCDLDKTKERILHEGVLGGK